VRGYPRRPLPQPRRSRPLPRRPTFPGLADNPARPSPGPGLSLPLGARWSFTVAGSPFNRAWHPTASLFEHQLERCPFGHSLARAGHRRSGGALRVHASTGSRCGRPGMGHLWISCRSCHDHCEAPQSACDHRPPGVGRPGHLGGVSPVAVDLAGGGPGYDREALPPMTGRNWQSWAMTVTVWPAWIMPTWILGCDHDATRGRAPEALRSDFHQTLNNSSYPAMFIRLLSFQLAPHRGVRSARTRSNQPRLE
jgi:hypothetical protein